ncbi:unnamed protein product [Rotaria sordida]|uniref:F-BAR domain-containing protein n=1 Tax=Rotaria sordida TaxID=392033 RepID=A0A814DQG5_9BILA|nr:unnamed protein product [Rotaria sordida]CAF1105406.1 unnamed protein product [Rotaria sordida]
MNLFSRKIPIPFSSSSSSSGSNTARCGPEAFGSNSAYGRGFFELGAYSIALKRCENGHDLAQQLADMFEERAQLESTYATQLRAWSHRWYKELTRSQEYGTNKIVWEQAAKTGEQMADVHSILSISLSESLIPKLRQWRKDRYEKSLMQYKKTKEFEKEFLDAQKSWSKLLDRISECKTAYYTACKTAKLADDAEHIAPAEQRKKYADKAEVARREIDSTKTKYQQVINEGKEQRPRYELAMKEVFERTQAFEKERLDFFKETYDEYLKLLEIATLDNLILKKMIDDYKASLSIHNPQQDLTWWDQNYGTQTNSRWPEYEECRD